MSNHWPPGTMKIHEGCGGLVRWVEAVRTPGVGWTGECLTCHDEQIVVEDIVPIQTEADEQIPELVNAMDRDDLAALAWDDDADWDTNQTRLREVLV